jgi:cold shock CspA family protein
MRGKLLWFNEDKKFGFIRTDEGERLYVHLTGFAAGHVPNGPCAGTVVDFERLSDGGPDGTAQAVGVAELQELPARRARLRSRNSIH